MGVSGRGSVSTCFVLFGWFGSGEKQEERFNWRRVVAHLSLLLEADF